MARLTARLAAGAEHLVDAPMPEEAAESSDLPTAEQPTAPAPTVDAADLPTILESLLFIASTPTPVARLSQVLGFTAETIETVLDALARSFVDERRGVRLLRKGDRVHLTSAPEAAPHIERFLGLDLSSKLSAAALETLAVIAYRQPLTRVEVEAIRGVSCEGVLRTLIARELVEPVGRLEQAGRPFLYGTTIQFLQYFGLDSLASLPALPEPAA